MCGILGHIGREIQKPDTQEIQSVLRHRGPDNFGYIRVGKCALWHYRLSILDTSELGNQPLTSPCGQYTMVFNGEIYNYRQLREDHKLSCVSNSDSEVVLLLYQKLGVKMLSILQGMFSIAIWNEEDQSLFLARDRMGIKPLFYTQNANGFFFASEIKGLKVLTPLAPTNKYLGDYLSLGFIPETNTFYREVYKVRPGQYIRVENQQVSHHDYYVLHDVFRKKPTPAKSYDQAKKQLVQLLYQGVEERLISDVPLGCFLSGGIDSSLVASVAQNIHGGPLKTFSIGFGESLFNESVFAEAVAQHIGSEHYNKLFDQDHLIDIFSNYLALVDQPFGDTSLLPTSLVSQFAREHVTVALSGDGGDEGFMGYGMYTWAQRLSNPCLAVAGRIAKPVVDALGSSRYKRAFGLFGPHSKEHGQRHIFSQEQYLFSEVEVSRLVVENTGLSACPALPSWMSAQEKQAFFDYSWYLPDDLLVKVDRASMASSLEVRVPLLDHRIIEFAVGLPLSWKKRKAVTKYILKDILFDHVPENLFNRPKQGFSVPLAQYIKGPLRPWVEQYLKDDVVRNHGWVFPNLVKQYKRRFFEQGEEYLYHRIFLLAMLHQWLEKEKQTP